jgi:hypothetical protein
MGELRASRSKRAMGSLSSAKTDGSMATLRLSLVSVAR